MDIDDAVGTYLDVADELAPGMLEGLYVVGSFALGDWQPDSSDVDIVAITAEPATDDDAALLAAVHQRLAEVMPTPFIDGPYVAWGDLVVPPATGLHRPWTLDGVLHHDSECFEINPVTWYTLATYGVVVRGPRRDRLEVALDTESLIRFVSDNLRSYWIGVANQIRAAVSADPGRSFAAEVLEWTALGALRLHYTAFTGDVTSKRGAGEYGLRAAPDHFHPLLHRALDLRAGTDRLAGSATELTNAAELIEWCATEVARSTPTP